jgi:hypothetical protein
MRIAPLFVPFVPLALVAVATVAACGSVPDDPGARIFPPGGVIEGTVLYQGPRPCSMNGHIVGAAVMLVFDRQNPPPPNGLGATVVNFADVTGDALFANEPRYTGSSMYCPYAEGFTDTITVSASFAVSPVPAGSYIIQSFYDYTGDFLPTFKFRELPEQGDIGGGDIDTADALKDVNAGNPNYQPHFLEIDVGTPQPLPDAGLPPTPVPAYTLPSEGYVANNVSVSVGLVLPLTRPYFYPQGVTQSLSSDGSTLTNTIAQSADVPACAPPSGQGIGSWSCSSPTTLPGEDAGAGTVENDANYLPILTIPQDIQGYSAPSATPQNANQFELVLPHLKLVFGVANGPSPSPVELPTAMADPFHFQLLSTPSGSNTGEGAFAVWQNAIFNPAPTAASPEGQWLPLQIPEGAGVPQLWPVVILSKLIDDPGHSQDPASLTAQGSATAPAVIIQGITFLESPQQNPFGNPAPDTLFNTVLAGGLVGDDTLFNLSAPAGSPAVGPSNSGTPNVFQQDELTIALRPSAICFNHLFDGSIDNRGVLISPYQFGPVANFPVDPTTTGPIVPTDLLDNGDIYSRAQVTNLVNSVQYGCLPTGRYEINVVYPDGQAWTVPNEAGACVAAEGTTDYTNLTCTLQPRPIVHSQGTRAVVEITATNNPMNCVQPSPPATTDLTKTVLMAGSPAPAVPPDCCPVGGCP